MLSWTKRSKVSETTADVVELKRDYRKAMFAEGRLLTQYRSIVDVALINMSETGACLRGGGLVGAGISIGDTVELSVPLRGIKRSCIVTRRDGEEIGVEFGDIMTRVKLARGAKTSA